MPLTILFHELGIRLDGIAKTAMVEVGDSQLAGYFAEKGFSKLPHFRNGMLLQQAMLLIITSSTCWLAISKFLVC